MFCFLKILVITVCICMWAHECVYVYVHACVHVCESHRTAFGHQLSLSTTSSGDGTQVVKLIQHMLLILKTNYLFSIVFLYFMRICMYQ